jgi:hypothetical protein
MCAVLHCVAFHYILLGPSTINLYRLTLVCEAVGRYSVRICELPEGDMRNFLEEWRDGFGPPIVLCEVMEHLAKLDIHNAAKCKNLRCCTIPLLNYDTITTRHGSYVRTTHQKPMICIDDEHGIFPKVQAIEGVEHATQLRKHSSIREL